MQIIGFYPVFLTLNYGKYAVLSMFSKFFGFDLFSVWQSLLREREREGERGEKLCKHTPPSGIFSNEPRPEKTCLRGSGYLSRLKQSAQS